MFFNHAAFENSTKIPFLTNNNDRKISRKIHAQKLCFVFNFIPNEFMQTEMKYERCVRSRGFKCYCLNGRWMERDRHMDRCQTTLIVQDFEYETYTSCQQFAGIPPEWPSGSTSLLVIWANCYMYSTTVAQHMYLNEEKLSKIANF